MGELRQTEAQSSQGRLAAGSDRARSGVSSNDLVAEAPVSVAYFDTSAC